MPIRLTTGTSLIASLLVAVCLAACAGPTGQVQPPGPDPETGADIDVSGAWQDSAATFSVCENYATRLSAIGLTLSQDEVKKLSGTAIFEDLEDGTTVEGQFTGAVEATNRIEGEIALIDRNADVRTYDVSLGLAGDTLAGTFVERSPQSCPPDGWSDYWRVEVAFVRQLTEPVPPDAAEPNNGAGQATMLEAGTLLDDLSLSAGDIDWFTFTLAETSVVDLTVWLDSAFDARAWLLAEGQTARTPITAYGLQAQSNVAWLLKQMSPGVYYLVVTGSSDAALTGEHSENGTYSISLEVTAVPDSMYEPNDHYDQASKITLDLSANLYLGPHDVDWFGFTLAEDRLVTFSANFENTSYDPWLDITMQTDGVPFQPVRFMGEGSATLPKGSYYLRVSVEGFQDAPYTLNISTRPSQNIALEPNESLDQAASIGLDINEALYMIRDEQDWFRFTLPEERLLRFNLLHATTHLSAHLYTETGGTLESFDNWRYNETVDDLYTALDAGVYYLLVYQFGDAETPYTLSIVSEPLADGRYEPNDTREQATVITPDFSEPQMFLRTGDTDWYTFVLESTASLTVDLQFTTETSSYGTLRYFDESGVFRSVPRQDGPYLLDADTYYLQVGAGYVPSPGIYYSIAVEAGPPPEDALEPNDSEANAYPVPLDNLVDDLFVSQESDDWFTFTLGTETSLLIEVIASATSDNGQWLLEIVDENREPVYNSQYGRYIGMTFNPVLDAGTYRMHVIATGWRLYWLRLQRE